MRLLGAVVMTAMALAPPGDVRLDVPRRDVLIDERISITLSGVPPRAAVTIHVRGGPNDGWTSNATFTADDSGTVDVTRMAPVRGSYKEVDAMGLFWSTVRRNHNPQRVARVTN